MSRSVRTPSGSPKYSTRAPKVNTSPVYSGWTPKPYQLVNPEIVWASDELAGVVLERFDEALRGDLRMNCDVCLYRTPLPGLEHLVGARLGFDLILVTLVYLGCRLLARASGSKFLTLNASARLSRRPEPSPLPYAKLPR